MTTPVDPSAPPMSQPVVLSPGTPGGIEPPVPAVQPPVVDVPEFADEEVLFRKDGTVVLVLGGQRTVLRRPKFKELRALHEQINDLAAESRAVREPLQERLRALTAEITAEITALDTDDPESAKALLGLEERLREVQSSDEFLAVQADLRKHRDEADYALLDWFLASVLVPFGKPVVRIDDAGDLPPWVIDAAFTRELLQHWSSVPRRPGVV